MSRRPDPIGDFLATLTADIRRTAASLAQPDFAADLALALTESVRETALVVTRSAMKGVQASIEEWLEATKHAVPSNWEPLTWPEIFDVGDFMGRTGWSLAWTPPAEVVKEVIGRSDVEDAKEDLLPHEGRILDDLSGLLQRAEGDVVRGVRTAIGEALETHRCGFFRASQTLSAATLMTVVHDHLGHPNPRGARRSFRRDFAPTEVGIRMFRTAVVLDACSMALEGFDVSGRSPRKLFNRAETVHRVAAPQHSQANSLTALMLVCSLVYELSEAATALEQMEPATRAR